MKANFATNLVSLYGVQAASMVLPLITLPFLARQLQPVSLGHFASAQALGVVLSVVIEFGFAYSATRKLIVFRDAPEQHAWTANTVLSAKSMLSLMTILLGMGIILLIPNFRQDIWLYTLGILYAIAQGFTPIWYFQGIEDVRLPASVDVAMKALATCMIFLLIRHTDQAWLVLFIQVFFLFLAQLINTSRMYRSVAFQPPSIKAALEGIRENWSGFIFRSSVALYTSVNIIMVRAFLPSSSAAYYSNAEKSANTLRFLVFPVSQIIFPRIGVLLSEDKNKAVKFVKKVTFLITAINLSIATIFFIFAPIIIVWYFGASYRATVPIFQVLCISVPIITVSNILGAPWMLNNGLDRQFNIIVLLGGLINVLFGLIFIHYLGAVGMAYAILITETFITLSILIYLTKMRNNPLQDINILMSKATRKNSEGIV